MKIFMQKLCCYVFVTLYFFCFPYLCFGGLTYQNFEGPGELGWPGDGTSACRSIPGEPVHSGNYSFRVGSSVQWNYFYVRAGNGGWDTDFLQENNDRLIFWVYSLPQYQDGEENNTVGVRFYDRGNYSSNGFEVWTTHEAQYGEWTKLTILFHQLPSDLDLHHIDKLEFKNYWPGTYYIDDIQAVHEDLFYQSFEPNKRGTTDPEEFGWTWGGTCHLSELGEPVYEGQNSWKIILTEYWAGTGIKSEYQYYVNGQQLFWHTNLNSEVNDHISFWVYALPSNGLDNNVNIQFYDHDAHHTDETKVEFWTNKAARYGQWTQLTVPFTKLDPTLNLNDIDKIQLQMYWPGTYYVDSIEATSSVPNWDRSSLWKGVLKWASGLVLDRYRLQENSGSGWIDVYLGTDTSFTIPRISKVSYRVRSEEVQEGTNEVPFVSSWSEVCEYEPPAVVINKSKLSEEQMLEWTWLLAANEYQVQSAPCSAGPWVNMYYGPYPAAPLPVSVNTWYRVRALKNGETETSPWSPAQWKPNPITKDFLRASGTIIRKESGNGGGVPLCGINLGGFLLIEDWMQELGTADDPPVEDDWSIREILKNRFGIEGRDNLLGIYQDAFLKEADFDILMRMGVNLVRLPIYYLTLQDEEGNWITDDQGEIDFGKIDWVVNACANRGIYVLLDLHGAPGSQSKEFHTGRKDFNRLFEDSLEGEEYRSRTVKLWEAIATHYKHNSTVMGYDLLNEPTGPIADIQHPQPTELEKLWNFYNRLYQAIRAIDPAHIIVMEGVWDWDTLPKPSERGWENVVYQFHYYEMKDLQDAYYGDLAAFIRGHKDFIDAKIAMANEYQNVHQYRVPVMIGEFNAFSVRENWEYYLEKFNQQGWSWAVWSYKVSWPNSTWGLLTDHSYDKDKLPKFRTDTYEELAKKLAQYDTMSRYVSNYPITAIIEDYASIRRCKGDFDGDGDVDGSDLAVFAENFGRTDCDQEDPCESDLDNDNDVDGSDLVVFATDFARTDCDRAWDEDQPNSVGTRNTMLFELDFSQDGTFENNWTMQPNDVVLVDIYASNVPAPGLLSIGMDLVYNPLQLQVAPESAVDMANWDVAPQITFGEGEVEMKGGRLLPGLEGDKIKLATLKLKCMNPGLSELWIYDSDRQGTYDDFVLSDGTVLDGELGGGILVANVNNVVNMALDAGWSMISLPVVPESLVLSDIFPEAVVVYGFERNSGYVHVQANKELEVGKGYWILVNEAQSYTLTGQPIESYTISIDADGWLMIGGCTEPAKASVDTGNIGVIYKFTQEFGYRRVLESESLERGKAYWILVNNVVPEATISVETVD